MRLIHLLLLSLALSFGAAQTAPVDAYLSAGDLAAGAAALEAQLATEPQDDDTRFALGMLQFLQAIEQLAQSWHRYGLQADQGRDFGIPILRLPVPPNPDPEAINYTEFRAVFETFGADLAKAEATLAAIRSSEVKLPIRFGMIRLDLDGDGVATDAETFWQIYVQFNQQARLTRPPEDEEERAFIIAFDKGDVHWLRGYSHLLMAMTEVYLAYDAQALFEHTAQLFFPRVETPYMFLQDEVSEDVGFFDLATVADAITLIHLINLELEAPERMGVALEHLNAVIRQSRLSWDAILAETDNEREWLPNTTQTSVIPATITPEMITGWQTFLDEAEAILAGDLLVPHWRVQDGRGINLKRVFTEPQAFDLIRWFQGTAALPYLEQGERTEGETWARLQRLFGGNFIGFAVWFN